MAKTTLQILDERLEADQDGSFRPHLGASLIGNACQRQTWYNFRWAKTPHFKADVLRKFRDGHLSEDLIGEELALVVDLIGRQARFRQGHFGGSVDGIIRQGLAEAPDEPHIWEHKAISDKRFEALQRLQEKRAHDPESVLAKWEPRYFEQAQIYMLKMKIDWHYMTVASAGSRQLLAIRTPIDEIYAREIEDKANRIIEAIEAPRKISESFTDFSCRFCDYSGLCHSADQPEQNCRTCRYSRALDDGRWLCVYDNRDLGEKEQAAGCDQYRRFLDGGLLMA